MLFTLCILRIYCIVHRDFRKPLVIVTPKNLLRDKKATSSLQDMGENTTFQRVYAETDKGINTAPEKVKRLILCSGKIYYELVDERERLGLKSVAIVRIEQIAPFPWDHVAEEVKKYG